MNPAWCHNVSIKWNLIYLILWNDIARESIFWLNMKTVICAIELPLRIGCLFYSPCKLVKTRLLKLLILFINLYNNHGIKTNNMNSVTLVIIKQNSLSLLVLTNWQDCLQRSEDCFNKAEKCLQTRSPMIHPSAQKFSKSDYIRMTRSYSLGIHTGEKIIPVMYTS